MTTDNDFGLLVIRMGHRVPGLVVLRVQQLASPAVARKIAAGLIDNGAELGGRLTTISGDRTRRRVILDVHD